MLKNVLYRIGIFFQASLLVAMGLLILNNGVPVLLEHNCILGSLVAMSCILLIMYGLFITWVSIFFKKVNIPLITFFKQ